jgi:hypothetical protein
MSRFRFSALLALSLAVVAVIVLRRDKRPPEFAVPAAAPAEPVAPAVPASAAVEEPPAEEVLIEEPHDESVEEPAPRVQIPPVQVYPETDGVSGADPASGYWRVPPTPPADWSNSPSFGERRSA